MKRALALAVLMVALPAPSHADEDGQRETFAGIRSVQVQVEATGASDIALPGEIQTEVELKLRQAGIRVVTEKEMLPASGYPMLHVGVALMPQTLGGSKVLGHIYYVRANFNQWVKLIRKPDVVCWAATWVSGGAYGYVGRLRSSVVRDAVRAQVDEFLNAYLAANPPRR